MDGQTVGMATDQSDRHVMAWKHTKGVRLEIEPTRELLLRRDRNWMPNSL